MTKRGLILYALTIALSVGASARAAQHGPGKAGRLPLACEVSHDSVVRFFFNPENTDYYHFPLIFRGVPSGDPHLNTAPMGPEGRTAYITRPEMMHLIQGLDRLGLDWQESPKVDRLGSFRHLLWSRNLKILVACPKGTARAEVEPSKICGTLAPLDSALTTPRALWEFRLLRIGYGCKVKGFNMHTYPGRH